MRLAALLACLTQDPGFGTNDRVVAATYTLGGPDAAGDLAAMAKAGVDLAVVGGEPLGPLVAALRARPGAGPRVALLLEPPRGAEGKALLYERAKKFYEQVPRDSWGRVAGRPIVWLGTPPASTDAAMFDDFAARFRADFGGLAPFLVGDEAWRDAPVDRACGPDGPVVSVAPGAKEAEYERAWIRALRLEPRWVAIEGWAALAAVKPALEATPRYVRKFRLNEKLTLPKGKWTDKVFFTLRTEPHEQGLRPVRNEDGLYAIVEASFPILTSQDNKRGAWRYLYFDVDDAYCFFEKKSFEVLFEYLDAGQGAFSLQYDSLDRSIKGEARSHKSAGERKFGGTGEWKTESFILPDAAFGNGQKGGADFRFAVEKRGLALRRVAVLPR